MKNKINTLSNILKKCEFDKTKLEACFQRGKLKGNITFHTHTIMLTLYHNHKHNMYIHAMHTHHEHTNAHAHHVHTPHAFLYAKVYTCTYCGCKGHLTKFCYDKLNASYSHVWDQKTNIFGPKKVWVSKLTTTLHDIDTHEDSKT